MIKINIIKDENPIHKAANIAAIFDECIFLKYAQVFKKEIEDILISEIKNSDELASYFFNKWGIKTRNTNSLYPYFLSLIELLNYEVSISIQKDAIYLDFDDDILLKFYKEGAVSTDKITGFLESNKNQGIKKDIGRIIDNVESLIHKDDLIFKLLNNINCDCEKLHFIIVNKEKKLYKGVCE